MYNSGTISPANYESESMSLDYCGQMCDGVDETIFMGVQETKCYCIDDLAGSLLLSNRACNTKCPGDSAELCGGKGALTIQQLKNDSFTDLLAIVTGSHQGKREVHTVMEDGTECLNADNGIPNNDDTNDPIHRGVTVIEDHTIVACGGHKFTSSQGMY